MQGFVQRAGQRPRPYEKYKCCTAFKMVVGTAGLGVMSGKETAENCLTVQSEDAPTFAAGIIQPYRKIQSVGLDFIRFCF